MNTRDQVLPGGPPRIPLPDAYVARAIMELVDRWRTGRRARRPRTPKWMNPPVKPRDRQEELTIKMMAIAAADDPRLEEHLRRLDEQAELEGVPPSRRPGAIARPIIKRIRRNRRMAERDMD